MQISGLTTYIDWSNVRAVMSQEPRDDRFDSSTCRDCLLDAAF